MSSPNSPWTILGIDRKADRREIRSAYAKLLKTVRPDEDPKAFQRLREARDQALRQLQYDVEYASFERTESPEEPPSDIEPEIDDRVGGEEDWSGSPFMGKEVVEPEEVSPPALIDAHYVDQTPAAPDEEEAPNLEDIRKRFDEFFNSWESRWDIEAWQSILSDMLLFNVYERRELEYHLIEKIGQNDTETSNVINRRQILSLLNEEFGWVDNDRVIYQVLPNDKADSFISAVRHNVDFTNALSLDETFTRSPTRINDAERVPHIDLADIRDFFDDKKGHKNNRFNDFINYYNNSVIARRWKASWNWWGFVFTYIWTAWRGLWKDTIFLLLMSSIGLISLRLGVSDPEPFFVLIGVPLIALAHILPSLNSKQLLLKRLVRVAKHADRKAMQSNEERSAYIKKQGRKRFWLALIPVLLLGSVANYVSEQVSHYKPVAEQKATAKSSDFAKCRKGDAICLYQAIEKLQKTKSEQKNDVPVGPVIGKDKLFQLQQGKKIPYHIEGGGTISIDPDILLEKYQVNKESSPAVKTK